MAIHSLTKQEVAIKIIKQTSFTDKVKLAKVKLEVKILSSFHHPHIMRVYDLIESEGGLFIVMEYIAGGELYDLILKKQRFSESESRTYFQQLIHAIAYCHQHGVVHRDIKPENILLDDQGQIKLGDFGLANYFKDGIFMKTSCGSLNYAAPEIISGDIYSGPEVDIWSAGVVLFLLVSGYLPFDESNVYTLFQKIKSAEFVFPAYVSLCCQDLITRMLNPDSVNRITLSQIHHHPWFQVNMPNHLTYLTDYIERKEELMCLIDCKVRSSHMVDKEIFRECMQFNLTPANYTKKKIKRRLEKQKQDEFCVAYRIMHDRKQKRKRTELNSIDVNISPAFSINPRSSFEPRSSTDARGSIELRKSSSIFEDFDPHSLLFPHNWNFGFRINSNLTDCMELLLKACLKLNLVRTIQEIKKLAEFSYRFVLGSIKFECKIFKAELEGVAAGVFVINFRRHTGPPMHFMTICADLYLSMHKSNRKVLNREQYKIMHTN